MAISLFFRSKTDSTFLIKSEDLPNNILQSAYNEWLNINSDNSIPDKSDIKIETFGGVYEYVALVNTTGKPLRPKYDIVGEKLTSILGEEISFMYVDQIYTGSVLEEVMSAYRQVVENKKALYTRKTWRTLVRKVGYDRLLLPFTDGGEEVKLVVACFTPTDKKIMEKSDWRNADDIKPFLDMLDLNYFDTSGLALEE